MCVNGPGMVTSQVHVGCRRCVTVPDLTVTVLSVGAPRMAVRVMTASMITGTLTPALRWSGAVGRVRGITWIVAAWAGWPLSWYWRVPAWWRWPHRRRQPYIRRWARL